MMARTIKKEDYAVRRKEILDAAQRLVYTKGYEQMAIQDILNELQISKGAFYHYFGSKLALLEALIERIKDEGEQLLIPIVQDPQLGTLEKIQHFFDVAASWKTERKAYLLALLRIWYTDENAIVRQKLQAALIKQTAPLLTTVVRQGIKEGVLTNPFPDQAGEIVLTLLQSLGDAFVPLILDEGRGRPTGHSLREDNRLNYATNLTAAYNDALERILGAPKGSLHLIDAEMLKEWVSL
jgi:TetR/AcrR family transcriptional repressor of nem operon